MQPPQVSHMILSMEETNARIKVSHSLQVHGAGGVQLSLGCRDDPAAHTTGLLKQPHKVELHTHIDTRKENNVFMVGFWKQANLPGLLSSNRQKQNKTKSRNYAMQGTLRTAGRGPPAGSREEWLF